MLAPRAAPRFGRVRPLALLVLLTGCPGAHAGRGSLVSRLDGAAFVASAPVTLAPDLRYREIACRVGGDILHLRELQLRPGASLQLRAVLNASAHTDARCSQRYGGSDLREVLPAVPGFRALGATNGNFFHRLGEGFRANGMIWSLDSRGPSLLAPVQPTVDPDFRGDRVAVVDAQGLHELRIETGACEPGACTVSLSTATSPQERARFARRDGPMSQDEFVAAMRAAYPTMTLAMQLNHAYAAAPGDALAESFRCTPARRWTCDPHPVTLLCGTRDGAVSLLAAERVSYPALPVGLRPGGACDTRCETLYILDGGGSTQIGYTDAASGAFRVEFAGKVYPNAPNGCATYRPVDHYLAIGAATAEGAPTAAPIIAPTVLE